MEFTIRQYGRFSEDVYFDVPDETIRQKLEEYQRQGLDEDDAREALEDYICSNRWNFQTDYGDRDDDTDDWEYLDDFYDGIRTAMGDYDEQEEDVGEL